MKLKLLLILYFFVCYGSAIDIVGKLVLPDGETLDTMRIALNGGEMFAYSRRDGSFIFHSVTPGVHVIDVHSAAYHFSQMKIKVPGPSETENIQALEFVFPGAPKRDAPYPLRLVAHSKWSFFEPRGNFSLLGTIKRNPMIVIMIGIISFVSLAPKLMAYLDPDALRAAQEEKQRMMGRKPNSATQSGIQR